MFLTVFLIQANRCELGLFKYKKLAQGLANAPATFQRLIDKVFASQLLRGIVSVYFDDFLIHTTRLGDHKPEVNLTVKELKDSSRRSLHKFETHPHQPTISTASRL